MFCFGVFGVSDVSQFVSVLLRITLDGNVIIVWVFLRTLNGPYISAPDGRLSSLVGFADLPFLTRHVLSFMRIQLYCTSYVGNILIRASLREKKKLGVRLSAVTAKCDVM